MSTSLEDIVADLAETPRDRVYGKYRGLVRDVEDPEGKCRIRAEVPAVLEDELTPWAMPCLPFAGDGHGLVLLPEVDDGVWSEFEGGDISRPIWSGCWFKNDERPTPDGVTQRLLATSAGHQILLDEDADEMRLTHPGGAEIVIGAQELTISLGNSSIRMSSSEINLNDGMVKVTTAGASLVNDAFKVGA